MITIRNQNFQQKILMHLRLTSVVEKDLKLSAYLIKQFIEALRRWLLTRGSQNPTVYFAENLPCFLDLKKTRSASLFTVIRSPFVYKKTREQFKHNKQAWTIHVSLSKAHQSIFLQYVAQLKLPAELKVIVLDHAGVR